MELLSLYIESVAMGNYIVTDIVTWLLVVAADYSINENHHSPREKSSYKYYKQNMRPLTEEETQSVFEKLAK